MASPANGVVSRASASSSQTLSLHESRDPERDMEKVETDVPRNLQGTNSLDHTTSHRFGGLEDDDDVVSSVMSKISTAATATTPPPRSETVLATLRSRQPRGPFSHPLAQQQTAANVLVDFDGKDDPYRPSNWTMKKKVITTILYGVTTMTATWSSAALASGTSELSSEFHVGDQVGVLGTSLFMVGFGLGPLLWAPISEVFGRRIAVIPPSFIGGCFTFAVASAANIQTVMICRFFSGFFSSAPVTNSGGVLADLFGPAQRAYGLAGYAAAVVLGPTVAPVVSSAFVSNPSLGWRWTMYFTGIIEVVMSVVLVILVDETYPPALLVAKARRLRFETGNWALHAEFEQWDVSIKAMANRFMVRPFQIMATPIGFFMCLYSSSCYGILYMQLGAVPIIFRQDRGWPIVSASLPFCAAIVGCFMGMATNVANQTRFNKIMRKRGSPLPEARLPPMMLGGVFFAAGQFLIGWTANPRYFWIAPMIGYVLFGWGFLSIFQTVITYLVDTFTKNAASAIAANTALRSAFACGLPLAVTPMYAALGPGFASVVTGGFAAAMIPVPFVFYFYGEKLRARSQWSRDSVK